MKIIISEYGKTVLYVIVGITMLSILYLGLSNVLKMSKTNYNVTSEIDQVNDNEGIVTIKIASKYLLPSGRYGIYVELDDESIDFLSSDIVTVEKDSDVIAGDLYIINDVDVTKTGIQQIMYGVDCEKRDENGEVIWQKTVTGKLEVIVN